MPTVLQYMNYLEGAGFTECKYNAVEVSTHYVAKAAFAAQHARNY